MMILIIQPGFVCNQAAMDKYALPEGVSSLGELGLRCFCDATASFVPISRDFEKGVPMKTAPNA